MLSLLAFILLSSCEDKDRKNLVSLIKEWDSREVLFPTRPTFTIMGTDTVTLDVYESYSILSYIDSIGCMRCKLYLEEWRAFIAAVDTISPIRIPFFFFIHPRNMDEATFILQREHFLHPVCIDIQDSLNILNRFPADERFHTFLLDKDNKVLAIGNPVLNPKIRELYLNIIQGNDVKNKEIVLETTVSVDISIQSLGSFDWQQPQQTTFTLRNIGKHPLLITDAITSCGCTTVEFPKEAIEPGGDASLHVEYQADSPESVDTTIKVYANISESSIVLRIIGEAKE
jgi:hypothetical protein